MITGKLVDDHGRCVHYAGPTDIVGNKCSTCEKWWACHLCHAEQADHPFGKMPSDAPDALQCGACGTTMSRDHGACPNCGHGFNPGCQLHAHLYFQD